MPPSSNSPPAIRILVVDDEPDLRTVYELTLLREGHRVETAENLAQARVHLERERFDLVITDMRLPDGLGLELLQELAQRRRPERAIVITAYGSAENAVESLKAGAFDYLTKPVDLKQFRAVVASAIRGVAAPAPRLHAAQEGRAMPRTDSGTSALEKMVGNSDVMRAVKERIAKVARSMAPVLVRGESGTGKELVARAIHDCSHRAAQAFVAVNCSAIPESLLEAEFFGAKKGSYTGATQDRPGYFQAASGGTLFLDEIGDLPLAMQSKLLRAIQERSVRPLGSTQEDQVDVRIVSATHKDLAAEVQAQQFRQDLFYRLNVIEILIPPLRERREDLPSLCAALLERIAHDSGMPVPVLAPEVLEQLCMLRLSGNVRELENLLHRAVALSDGSALHVDFAPTQATTLEDMFGPTSATNNASATSSSEPVAQAANLPDDLQRYLDHLEREVLVRALQEHRFNRTAAAASMGLNLRQMRYRMARLNIQAPRDDDGRDDSA